MSGVLVTVLGLLRSSRPGGCQAVLSILPLISSCCVFFSSRYPGLPVLVQATSWCLLLLPLPLSLLSQPAPSPRLTSLSLALITSYLLLSLSYEALFLPLLCVVMAVWAWIEMESSPRLDNMDKYARYKNVVSHQDVFCVLTFFFIIFMSFFSTGNISSLNSFDPSSIRFAI